MVQENNRWGGIVKTKKGDFFVEVSERGLWSLDFPKKSSKKSTAVRRKMSLKAKRHFDKASKLLRSYFNGKKVQFSSITVDHTDKTEFEQRVLSALKNVPYGKCVSYAELARRARNPKAVRAAGSVMRKNRLPILLPCHRVIRSDGKIGNYSGGPGWKAYLQGLESPLD